MSATSSVSMEWQTPLWLIDKCRTALGGYITLDPASSDAANAVVGAARYFTKDDDGLGMLWDAETPSAIYPQATLFLNPPGEKSGKLIRKFWRLWHFYSSRGHFHASVWVDFNLDHLRFIEPMPGDCLIIPRKRMAFVDPVTGVERKGAQIGGFIYFRGQYCKVDALFNPHDYLVIL